MKQPLHLDIAGMSCGHCVAAVKRQLADLGGVDVRQVTVGAADVVYDDGATSPSAIRQAVEAAGYQVVADRS